MVGSLSVATVLFFVGVVAVAGLVTGIAGFGFALVGTMALATVLPPSVAVVVMIVPILATNVSLLDELDSTSFRECAGRFWPLTVAALVGTMAGMVVLDLLPEEPVTALLGALTLGFVAIRQRLVPLPVDGLTPAGAFTDSSGFMAGFGFVSGILFGATNVGVQLVAYLRTRGLSTRVFVGVVAMVFVGINAMRVGAAGVLGMYPSLAVAAGSVALAVPGLAGVAAGKRIRPRLSESTQRGIVLSLLTVVGVRLLLGAAGVV